MKELKNNLEERFIELRNENSKYSIKILELEQELQKTREQLKKAEKVIQFYSEGYVVDQADWDDDDDADCVNTWNLYTGKRARQYFKDKQGEV